MSTIITGYCDHCKKQVVLTREKINIALVILLAIFTVGFGLLIYLPIYYKKIPNKCIRCGSISMKNLHYQTSQVGGQISHQQTGEECETLIITSGRKAHYCSLCGALLQNKAVETCPNCGNTIN